MYSVYYISNKILSWATVQIEFKLVTTHSFLINHQLDGQIKEPDRHSEN